MKVKSKTALPPLQLKTMVDKIMVKGNLTQNDIERACGFHLNYLSRQKGLEENGQPISKHLVEKLERKYEFLLTGRRTFEIGEQQIINQMADQITLLRSYVDVLSTELAIVLDPKNASRKKQELATTAREAVADQLTTM